MSLEEIVASELYLKILSESENVIDEIYKIEEKNIKNKNFIETYNFVRKLEENERTILQEMITNSSVDAVSSALSIIEGRSSLSTLTGDFRLFYENEEVGRDICALFLTEDERNRPGTI